MPQADRGEDPRVTRTRKLLQQALFDLLEEKDFASISVQDIAERATVNRATLYAHFPDKSALLDSLVREQFTRFVTHELPAEPTWSLPSLRALILATFLFVGELHRRCKAATHFDPLIERAVQQELSRVLSDWLQPVAGTVTAAAGDPGFPTTMASLMSWAIFGAAVEWSRKNQTRPAAEMAEYVLEVLAHGAANIQPAVTPG